MKNTVTFALAIFLSLAAQDRAAAGDEAVKWLLLA